MNMTGQHSPDDKNNFFIEIEQQISDLLIQMTLQEKVGQMTMVEKYSIEPDHIAEYFIGSVLSGGGGNPTPNSASSWRQMVNEFQESALRTRLGIPLIYAVDAVHGHNNVKGAVIFPHNIGLGATRDGNLIERIGQVTASELLATGVHWTFAPEVSVPQDIRWGRTYEGYAQSTEVVSELGAALVQGLQGNIMQSDSGGKGVLACAKHYIADGATDWGSTYIDKWALQQGSNASPQSELLTQQADSSLGQWQIDQGVSTIDETELRTTHLPPYQAAIEVGVLSIMISYSSWGELKMHAHRYLQTEVLKEELGFQGLLVTDWMAINQIDPDYYTCVVTSINAGLDMIMVPYDYKDFISKVIRAVDNNDIALERIDDAVRRILRAKIALRLFEDPLGDESLIETVGSEEHREIAREAVRKSLVLLKNDNQLLPLPNDIPELIVAGRAADDIGLQCGGWSVSWQGEAGSTTEGTTILEGIQDMVSDTTSIKYVADGEFGTELNCKIGIVVIHEEPYAEGFGDRADLALSAESMALIDRVRDHCEKLVVVLIAGRPQIITDQLTIIDSLVMAWLPGTEGQGVADVIFGDRPFTGKLPMSWPRSMNQIPLAELNASKQQPLWKFGHGL